MCFKSWKKLIEHFFAMMFNRNIPGLVINSCTGNIQFFSRNSEYFCNLHFSMNFSMTQTNCFYFSIFIACPGCHCIWVGIVQHNCSRFCNFTNIFTKSKHCSNHTLSIHNSTRTQSISHTLVYSVF